MSVLDCALLVVFGVAGGMLSGLAGVGGGVVFVPTLVYAAGWDIREAVAASLLIMAFGALSGTVGNQKSGDPPDWKWVSVFAISVAPSSLIGVAVSRVSPERLVELAFAMLLLLLVYPMAKGRPRPDGNVRRIPVWVVPVAGVFIGSLSGLVGVGGGVVMVPLMVLGLGISTKRAVSTSLAVVMFTGVVAGFGYFATGFDRVAEVPFLVAGSVVGAWFGVMLRDRLPERVVRVGFSVFMVIVAARTLYGVL